MSRPDGPDVREGPDWVSWHEPYEDPASPLSRRLAAVQAAITAWLDRAPARPLRVVSCCAGQGRDLVGALECHPRAPDVEALLVEANPGNAEVAARLAESAGVAEQVTIAVADASITDAFVTHVPADLVLLCGVFGNISAADIECTIGIVPSLCAEGATVVWTRHRRTPDRTPDVRRWFDRYGFEELSWCAPDDAVFAVGVHRLTVPAAPFRSGVRMFDFVGDGHRPA